MLVYRNTLPFYILVLYTATLHLSVSVTFCKFPFLHRWPFSLQIGRASSPHTFHISLSIWTKKKKFNCLQDNLVSSINCKEKRQDRNPLLRDLKKKTQQFTILWIPFQRKKTIKMFCIYILCEKIGNVNIYWIIDIKESLWNFHLALINGNGIFKKIFIL